MGSSSSSSASSAPMMTSVRRSSMIRDRSRWQRRARLVSDGKGVFVCVGRNVQQKQFCEGIACSLATRTLDRKCTLWVIGSGATGIKCSRQWKTNILAKLQSKKDCSFLWQWRWCISYGAYMIVCAVPYLLAIESILDPAVIVAILAQVLCVFVASWR